MIEFIWLDRCSNGWIITSKDEEYNSKQYVVKDEKNIHELVEKVKELLKENV